MWITRGGAAVVIRGTLTLRPCRGGLTAVRMRRRVAWVGGVLG